MDNGNVGIGTNDPQVDLDVAGDIQYTGTLADMSDRRLKASITPLSGHLARIMQLQPVSFVMKDDPDRVRELGLIAQDVEPVFPELVGDSGGLKSMNYVGMIAPLVGAVQELKAENDDLAAENAEFAAENDELRRMVQSLSRRMDVIEGKARPPLKPYNR